MAKTSKSKNTKATEQKVSENIVLEENVTIEEIEEIKTKEEKIQNIISTYEQNKTENNKQIKIKTIVQENKNPKVIAKSATAFRKYPTLENKHVVGQMPLGIAFDIVSEKESSIYGSFYKLSNGYYITKKGNYTII